MLVAYKKDDEVLVTTEKKEPQMKADIESDAVRNLNDYTRTIIDDSYVLVSVSTDIDVS